MLSLPAALHAKRAAAVEREWKRERGKEGQSLCASVLTTSFISCTIFVAVCCRSFAAAIVINK